MRATSSATLRESDVWGFSIDCPVAVRRIIGLPDGVAACTREGPLVLMDPKLRQVRGTLPAPPSVHNDAAPDLSRGAATSSSPNYALATATFQTEDIDGHHDLWAGWSSGHISVYSLPSGELKGHQHSHRGAVHCIANCGSLMITASADKMILLWEGRTAQPLRSVSALLQLPSLVRVVAYRGEPHRRKVFLGCDDGTVRAVDLDALVKAGSTEPPSDAVESAVLSLNPASVRSLCVDANGTLWAGGSTGVVATLSVGHVTHDGVRMKAPTEKPFVLKLKHGSVQALCPLTASPGNASVLAGCYDGAIVALKWDGGGSAKRLTALFSIPSEASVLQLAPSASSNAVVYSIGGDGNVDAVITSAASQAKHVDPTAARSVTAAGSSGMSAQEREASVRLVEQRYAERLQDMICVVRAAKDSAGTCEDALQGAIHRHENLDAENEQLRSECQRLVAALNDAVERCDGKERAQREAQAQSSEAIAETIRLNAECSAQARLLDTLQSDEERHAVHLESLRDQIGVLEKTVARREVQVDDLEKEMAGLRDTANEERNMRRAAEDELEKVKRTLEAMTHRAKNSEVAAEEATQRHREESRSHDESRKLLEDQQRIIVELQRGREALQLDLRHASLAQQEARDRERRANQQLDAAKAAAETTTQRPPTVGVRPAAGPSVPLASPVRQSATPNQKLLMHYPLDVPASRVVTRATDEQSIRPSRGIMIDL